MSNDPGHRLDGTADIMMERTRQVLKGYTVEWDSEEHPNRELTQAAIEILEPHKPIRGDTRVWFDDYAERYEDDYEGALRVAGALIAAELDRVLNSQDN